MKGSIDLARSEMGKIEIQLNNFNKALNLFNTEKLRKLREEKEIILSKGHSSIEHKINSKFATFLSASSRLFSPNVAFNI